jgi:hypothetical protein
LGIEKDDCLDHVERLSEKAGKEAARDSASESQKHVNVVVGGGEEANLPTVEDKVEAGEGSVAEEGG